MDYGGTLDQLTTPVMKSDDAVFPGENWFLYWKTSPSLWEGKLQEYQGPSPLFVPIYWALHSEHPESFDFGRQKPSTDLKRLEETAKKCGRELVFLFPLTPMPFLSNGGVPSYVSRTISKDKDNLAIAAFDSQNNLHKVFSFFDPKVFQAYRKFCYQFGQYLSQVGSSSRVMGLEAMKYEKGFFISFLKDHSSAFD